MQDSKQIDTQLLAAAMKRLASLQRVSCFDPINPESRPTEKQQEVLNDFGNIPVQFIVSGSQSGKSQTCSRLISWVLEENHPTWRRPSNWGNEPLFILVCGRTGKQIEESLLPKIRSYLEPGSYKEIRIGNIIQRLESRNGNRIVFQSLENANVARERIQSYVAHLVWQDELPPTMEIIDEQLRRLQARGGYYLASFTPLLESPRIQKFVDASQLPYSKKYCFHMLDNPLYSDPAKRAKIMAEMALLPESVRNTRLFGAWSTSDQTVYHWDNELMSKPIPGDYRYSWRHVVSVDPALSSALGLTVWVEEPVSGCWYLVHSEEISGVRDPNELEALVAKKTDIYNVIRRIGDPHEVWYMSIAQKNKRFHMGVRDKNSRKGELIKGLQSALGTRIFIPMHNEKFIDQLVECKWADNSKDRIVNSSKYHLCDSAQYFVDNIPKHEGMTFSTEWHVTLRKANEKRIARNISTSKIKRKRFI